MIYPHPRPKSDRRERSSQKSPEAALRCSTLPHHPQQDCAKQRSDEETEQRLHIVHDAGKLHDEIRSADTDQNTNNGAPSPDSYVVIIGRILLEKRSINVIG